MIKTSAMILGRPPTTMKPRWGAEVVSSRDAFLTGWTPAAA